MAVKKNFAVSELELTVEEKLQAINDAKAIVAAKLKEEGFTPRKRHLTEWRGIVVPSASEKWWQWKQLVKTVDGWQKVNVDHLTPLPKDENNRCIGRYFVEYAVLVVSSGEIKWLEGPSSWKDDQSQLFDENGEPEYLHVFADINEETHRRQWSVEKGF